MRIQHNIMAMNAYRNYNINTSAVSKNLEKLSSGYRINRAGDDAAGLAISEKMRAQITGLEAATKNVKDGISLVKTAEGAMQEVQDMLNRMVSLATQSANGTYADEVDRENLQLEVDQLRSEINRIADSSNFNGIKLLDGSLDAGTNVVSLKGGKDIATSTDTTMTDMKFTIVSDGQLVDKAPTAGKYYVDFSQAEINNTSDAGISVSFAICTDASGAVKSAVTIMVNGKMNGEDIAKALAEAIQKQEGDSAADRTDAYDSDVGVTLSTESSAKFKVYADKSKLVFEMVEPPAKDSDIEGLHFAADFDSTAAGAAGIVIKNQGAAVGVTAVAGNAGNGFKVQTETEAVSNASRVYAQAEFKLTNALVKDGAAIKIGDEVYTFAIGSNSKYKDYGNIVDLTDLTVGTSGLLTDTQLATAASRLAKAAENNKSFMLGSAVGSASIALTEREGGIDYNVNNLAGTDGKASINGATTNDDAAKTDWKGLLKFGTAQMSNSATGTALTLQIGDTSDSFNQLKVSIGDIHTKALGIDGVSVATQAGAQAAVDTIKNAINQVSSIRGTLGATQNRLEHTQNNLSVMRENIQDAESTIRDTDIAEEMMSYTKNNILVQSAQAMLAQANQIPQGVLQLLG